MPEGGSFESEMACRELVEVVTDYLQERLPAPEAARLEAHLRVCEGCTSYVEQMRLVAGMVGRLTVDDIPPDGREKLLRVLMEWKNS